MPLTSEKVIRGLAIPSSTYWQPLLEQQINFKFAEKCQYPLGNSLIHICQRVAQYL
jgi:hypothetical protein